MYNKQIPPVKAVDHKDNFIQNFFDRLMVMKIIDDSTAMQIFLDDSKFNKKKPKIPSNINQAVN